MQLVKIEAYTYEELSEKAKKEVSCFFDAYPFDYENDGFIEYDYFSDWNEAEKIEFCEVNEYLFNKHGKIINNLIIEEV